MKIPKYIFQKIRKCRKLRLEAESVESEIIKYFSDKKIDVETQIPHLVEFLVYGDWIEFLMEELEKVGETK